jgi:hypothetical protein
VQNNKQTSHQQSIHHAVIIVCAALTRLMSVLPPNFSPVGAMGLFAGAHMPWRLALLVSGAALLLSDAVIGFYHPVSMLFNYMGMGAGVVLGHVMLTHKKTMLRQVSAATFGAIAFFMLSNLGVWLSGQLYPLTVAGFMECYVAAIPFFQATLTSNLVFTMALFGLNQFTVHALAFVSRE